MTSIDCQTSARLRRRGPDRTPQLHRLADLDRRGGLSSREKALILKAALGALTPREQASGEWCALCARLEAEPDAAGLLG